MERKYWKSQGNLSVQKCGNHAYVLGTLVSVSFKQNESISYCNIFIGINVIDATQDDKVPTRQQYASDDVGLLQHRQCTRVPTEGRAVLWRQNWKKMEWRSHDISEVCKGVNASRTFPVRTTTQSIMFEGDRL